MKIVRPEQPIKKKEENVSLIIDGHECKSYTKEEMEFEYCPDLEELGKETEQKYQDFATKTIEDVMNEVLQENSNNVSFTVTLTKRQYDLYLKKGGESWLKKALTGQQVKKKSTKKR